MPQMFPIPLIFLNFFFFIIFIHFFTKTFFLSKFNFYSLNKFESSFMKNKMIFKMKW